VHFILKKHFCLVAIFSLGFFLMFIMVCCVKQPDREKSEKITINFNIREGKRLFLHYCSPCHGETAEGSGRYFPSYIDPQPPDFINSDYFQETNENVIFRAIKFGSKALDKSNYSPPYGETLINEEIMYIIKYLKFLKESKEGKVDENDKD
jgi:mono/diheme cytochrome c family protein